MGLLLILLFSVQAKASLFFQTNNSVTQFSQSSIVPMKSVTINANPLKIKEMKTIDFQVGPGLSAQAKIIRVKEEGNFITWVGRITDDPNGVASFAVDKRNPLLLSAQISMGGKSYSLSLFEDYQHYVFEAEDKARDTDETDNIPISEQQDIAQNKITTKSANNFIDVLVVYTDDALRYNPAVETLIAARMVSVNQILEDSCIGFRYRVVHVEPVTYNETGEFADDVYALYSPVDGVLDHLHDLRDMHGADLVQMVALDNGSWCGMAYANANEEHWDGRAFSVVGITCDDRTMAHEWGHNIGLMHDRYVMGIAAHEVDSDHADGFGWVDLKNKKRDIMSYSTQCSDLGISCPRIGVFSNPKYLYNATPFGDASYSDAVAFINRNFGYIANFRTPTTPYNADIPAECAVPETPSEPRSDDRCFIATAATGSSMHEDVLFLRNFRDQFLLKSPLGKSFVKFYYTISPPLAHLIENNFALKMVSRGLVIAVVWMLKNFMVCCLAFMGLGLLIFRLTKRSFFKVNPVLHI